MFPNLNAEQARYSHSNEFVATALGITRPTYESKKRIGSFSIKEVNQLCDLYNCNYAYLFSDKPVSPQYQAS